MYKRRSFCRPTYVPVVLYLMYANFFLQLSENVQIEAGPVENEGIIYHRGQQSFTEHT